MRQQPLHVTVDFPDDLYVLDRPMTPGEMDACIAYFAEIGVRRDDCP